MFERWFGYTKDPVEEALEQLPHCPESALKENFPPEGCQSPFTYKKGKFVWSDGNRQDECVLEVPPGKDYSKFLKYVNENPDLKKFFETSILEGRRRFIIRDEVINGVINQVISPVPLDPSLRPHLLEAQATTNRTSARDCFLAGMIITCCLIIPTAAAVACPPISHTRPVNNHSLDYTPLQDVSMPVDPNFEREVRDQLSANGIPNPDLVFVSRDDFDRLYPQPGDCGTFALAVEGDLEVKSRFRGTPTTFEEICRDFQQVRGVEMRRIRPQEPCREDELKVHQMVHQSPKRGREMHLVREHPTPGCGGAAKLGNNGLVWTLSEEYMNKVRSGKNVGYVLDNHPIIVVTIDRRTQENMAETFDMGDVPSFRLACTWCATHQEFRAL